MLTLYRAATAVALPAIDLLLWRRMARGKEDPLRIDERRGIPSHERPGGPLVWLHAASIGEAQSILRLVERLLHDRAGLSALVTTGTVTSADVLAGRLPARAIHQFVPVDRAAWVRRFLEHWRPDAALWVESELWPNLLLETHARGVPLALVNARISERSYRTWQRAPGLARRLLAAFDLVLAQDEAIAGRLRDLGARTVTVSGNLKAAAAALPANADALLALQDAFADRPLWLAASTHPGEEAMVGAAHRHAAATLGGLLTVLVPRHPRRGPEIAAELSAAGLRVARRSAGEPVTAETDIYVADTTGELGLFYRLAPLAFVGGSLVPHGGQNLLEAAQLGCAVLHGPHVDNFRAIAADLATAGASRQVADADTLAATVARLLGRPARLRAMAAAATDAARIKAEVLDEVLGLLAPLLDDACA
jgi:3-deoxy-D-manno-octulosonic-acid transferase